MNTVKQDFQPFRQIALRFFVGANRAARNVQQLTAVFLHHTKTGGPQARVNTKDTHGLRVLARRPCARQ